MAGALPISTTVLYQQPDGTFQTSSSGVNGETAITVPISDLVCQDDLDPGGAETTSDLQSLGQDIYHVFLEAPGSNLDDPTRGVGVEGLLSGSTDDLKRNVQTIDRQLELDSRVAKSTTTLTNPATGEFDCNTVVEPIGSVLPLQYTYNSKTGLQQVGQ